MKRILIVIASIFIAQAAFAECTPWKLTTAASNNSTLIKAGPGRVFWVSSINIIAGTRSIRLFNKATAPTCASDTPVLTLGHNTVGPALVWPINNTQFPLGIGICVTGGSFADNDNTSTGAGDLFITVCYE